MNSYLQAAMLLTFSTFANFAHADVMTFSNSTLIRILDNQIADPYPSAIDVTGVSGSLTNFTVSLLGVSHTFPDDMAAVIVSPRGTAVMLFSGPGGGANATNLNWTFDDNAAVTLPETGTLASGTFRPGLEQWDEFFPAPGPGGKLTSADPAPWSFTFQPLLSENPNGRWDLFILDGNSGDSGSVAGGWSVSFTTSATAIPEPSSLLSVFTFGLWCIPALRRRTTI